MKFPLNESQLKDKVAVIFGGSYGIGEHTAQYATGETSKSILFFPEA